MWQDLGVPKYKASASLIQHKVEFEKWLRALRPAIEKAALGFLSQRNLQLNASNGQSVTGWIYEKDEPGKGRSFSRFFFRVLAKLTRQFSTLMTCAV